MIYYDLIEYYKKERNEYNEIVLASKKTNNMHTFRRYIEFLTGRFLWADITQGVSKGVICTTEHVLKYFELPVIDIYGKYRNLKTGTILQAKNKQGNIEYYKKTYYDDIFIECDINGHTREPESYSLKELFERFVTVKVLESE